MTRVNTNIASLYAQRSLGRSRSTLGVHTERLSTGLRINHAQDDAAGLVITSRMSAQIRGRTRAVQNASDAISLGQTAESATHEVATLLQRMRELAVQAANDTNTSSDRRNLQLEIDQLLPEIDRIATETTFNGRTILDGSYNGIFQVGADAGQTIGLSIGDIRTSDLGRVAHITSTNGGASTMFNPLSAGDLVLDGNPVRATVPADDSVSVVLRASSAIAKAKAINEISGKTGITAGINATTVTGGAPVAGGAVLSGQLRINNVNIGAVVVAAGDATGTLRAAINRFTAQTGVVASLDSTNRIVLTAADGRNVFVLATAAATAATGLAFGTTFGTLTLTSDDQFVISGNAPQNAGFPPGVTTVRRDAATSVSHVNVTTQQNATTSIGYLDAAIRQLATTRARIGAVMNRLESTISDISSSVEQLTGARGRIEDADVAHETTELVREQIISQSSATIVAQANVSPTNVIRLLLAQ